MEEQGGTGRRPPPVRKSLGQHFLSDRNILARIANALELSGSETVIEIGPGRGSLTDLLVPKSKRIVAVEYDRALAAFLRDRYARTPSVEIVEADVLDVSFAELTGGDYVLAGNVPYYITTPILFKALARPRPTRAVYLVQREVAERIVAAAGTSQYGALSANVRALARAELLFRVPAGAFAPPPKVESAVIRITPRPDPVVREDEEAAYRTLVQGAFSFRRKQMRRVVRSLYDLDADRADALLSSSGVDPVARPETLEPEHFARLLRARFEVRG